MPEAPAPISSTNGNVVNPISSSPPAQLGAEGTDAVTRVRYSKAETGPEEDFTLLENGAPTELRGPEAEFEAKAKGRVHPRAPCTRGTAVHPLMVIVQFIFSGYHVLMSSALHTSGVNGLVFALYREIGASVLMLLLTIANLRTGGHSWAIEKRHVVRFVFMGLFSAGNVLGAVEALTLVTPTNFAVMQPSIPVFTMLLSVLLRMERVTWLKGAGLLCAVAGAISVEALSHGGDSMKKGSQNDFVLGNVVVVLQCLAMASLLVAQKPMLSLYHSTVVTTWYYSIGSLLTLIICIAKNLPSEAYALSHDTEPWIALAYAAVFGTAFNYNAYSWAGSIISPGLISIYSTVQPVGTALLSFFFLNTKPTYGEILGGALVILGLFLTVAGRDIEARLLRRQTSNGGGDPMGYATMRRSSVEAALAQRQQSKEYDERV